MLEVSRSCDKTKPNACRRRDRRNPRLGSQATSPTIEIRRFRKSNRYWTVNHVVTSTHFEGDLWRLPTRDRRRVLTVLRDVLPLEPLPANVDVKALKGSSPWLRLRVGDWRIVFRPLTRRELVAISRRRERVTTGGYYVETVVNRRELRRTARRLQ